MGIMNPGTVPGLLGLFVLLFTAGFAVVSLLNLAPVPRSRRAVAMPVPARPYHYAAADDETVVLAAAS